MIDFQSVSKRYGAGPFAVEGLDLEVPTGQVCALIGPSGGGKTTILKMVNRLVEPSAGRVLVKGRDVASMSPVELRRRTGYVIQQVGLFPHLKVLDNVAAVPRLLGWDKARTRARAMDMLELVGLNPDVFARRYPHELSGGQAQRVGVARALAGDPPVLLMDEPFGAVDPIARDHLQQEFLKLQDQLHKTVILVTHDVDEAIVLGNRLAVLREGGVLEQYGTPAEVLGSPATPFVADFIGADRGLRRLSVTAVEAEDLYQPPVVAPADTCSHIASVLGSDGKWAAVVDGHGSLLGWVEPCRSAPSARASEVMRPVGAKVELGSSLKGAFAEMLQHDAAWVAVLNHGRYLGVLTPDALHSALRRSVGGEPVAV